MLVIIGMPRSGSISLHQYLLDKDVDVKRDECIFKDNAIRYFESKWKGAVPIIIFRDPVLRCWSWYHYMKPDISYLQFLKTECSNIGFGEMNPIRQCNMKKFVTPFLKLDPVFYSFEKMITDPDFPTLNEGNTPPITKPHYDATRELLRKGL